MGPWRINQGTELGEVQNAYTFYDDLEPNPIIPANPSQTNGDTWVKEYCFDLSAFGANFDIRQFQTVNFRTTIECGNDLVKETHNVTITPEPGTMVLLGMGLLGLGAHLRRKK